MPRLRAHRLTPASPLLRSLQDTPGRTLVATPPPAMKITGHETRGECSIWYLNKRTCTLALSRNRMGQVHWASFRENRLGDPVPSIFITRERARSIIPWLANMLIRMTPTMYPKIKTIVKAINVDTCVSLLRSIDNLCVLYRSFILSYFRNMLTDKYISAQKCFKTHRKKLSCSHYMSHIKHFEISLALYWDTTVIMKWRKSYSVSIK